MIEVDPLTKQIVWSFGSGNSTLCNPGPGAIIGSNDAERLSGGFTVMAGTGIPAGVSGTNPRVDNRVIVVSQTGRIIWQYGQPAKTGSGFDLLNVPVFVIQLANHDFLIIDQGNNRVIQENLHHQIVWSYGPKSGLGALSNPNSAERLANGDTLIADENNNRVIEVNRAGAIVWKYSHGIAFAGWDQQRAGQREDGRSRSQDDDLHREREGFRHGRRIQTLLTVRKILRGTGGGRNRPSGGSVLRGLLRRRGLNGDESGRFVPPQPGGC